MFETPATTDFKWQTSDGLRLSPYEMKTDHLFNTLCLLWHHTMPVDAVLHPHKKWRLGPRFTHSYTRAAIKVLLTETLTRAAVLSTAQQITLEKMFAYLRKNQHALQSGPLRITR